MVYIINHEDYSLIVGAWEWPILSFFIDFTNTTIDFINLTFENIGKLFNWIMEYAVYLFGIALYLIFWPITVPLTLLLLMFLGVGFGAFAIIWTAFVIVFVLLIVLSLGGSFALVVFLLIYAFEWIGRLFCTLNGEACDEAAQMGLLKW